MVLRHVAVAILAVCDGRGLVLPKAAATANYAVRFVLVDEGALSGAAF